MNEIDRQIIFYAARVLRFHDARQAAELAAGLRKIAAIPDAQTYVVVDPIPQRDEPRGILCLRPGCYLVSYDPVDIDALYCGNCHKFHEGWDGRTTANKC